MFHYNTREGFALVLAVFIISIKGDSRFPLSNSLTELEYQILLLPYTIVFLLSIYWFFQPHDLNIIPPKLESYLEKYSILKLSCLIAFSFELASLGLMLLSNVKGTRYGSLNVQLALATYAFILGGLLFMILKNSPKPIYLFYLIVGAYVGNYVLCIVYFQLWPGRSDMFFLILQGGAKFLSGNNPYAVYSIPYNPPYTLPLTYLPGLWLSYLPSVYLGIDPRYINMISIVLSSIIIFYTVRKHEKEKALLFTTIFLLNPYLQYRHDIYLGVYWLPLTAAFSSLRMRKPLIATTLFAWSMTVSQFSWIIFPLFLLYMLRTYGSRMVLRVTLITMLVCLVVIGPFLVIEPGRFVQGVFGHWNKLMNVETINLSYWLSIAFSWKALKFIQFPILILLLAIFARKRNLSLHDCYIGISTSLLLFILLNSLTWTYMYLTVLLFLIFSALFAEPNLQPQ